MTLSSTRLAVRRDVAFADAVEVGAPHLERVLAELARDRVQHDLARERALRAAEAAEGGVALRVGLGRIAVDGHVGHPVGVVEVAQRASHHRAGQVGGEAGVGDHVDVAAQHAALVVEADFVGEVEAVAAAGDHEVVVAVGAQLDRPSEPRRADRGDAREQRRLRLLAAEAAAHAPAFDVHVVRVHVQRVRDEMLHLARVLRRAVHVHAVVLGGHRVRDLALEIELLLPADVEVALRACAARRRSAGARVAAHEVHRVDDVLLRRVRLLRRQHRRQRLDRDSDVLRLRGARRAASRVVAITANTGWPR